VVVAALAYYNPNTQLGHIEVRPLQPIPISSPVTDNKALSRFCMEAPPASPLKIKKKKKKKRPYGQAATTEPPSPGSATNSTPLIPMELWVKKLKKKKLTNLPSAISIPASVEKPSIERDLPPNLESPTLRDSSTAYTKTGIPLTTATQVSPPSTVNPVSTAYAEKGSPLTTATQVSPPPTVTPVPAAKASAPSSEESSKAGHGAIATFLTLKPKRVLHNYSELPRTNASPPIPRKAKRDEPVATLNRRTSEKNLLSQNPTGDVDKVERDEIDATMKRRTSEKSLLSQNPTCDGEKVERNELDATLKRRTSEKSLLSQNPTCEGEKVERDELDATLKRRTSDMSPLSQSTTGEGEKVEIQVRRTLEIQLAAQVAKRKSEGISEVASKRQRPTASSVTCSLENQVANLLVDLKSPMPKSGDLPSFQDFEAELGVSGLLHKLLRYSDSIPNPKSRLLTSVVNAFGSFPPQSLLEKILIEHRAAQVRIQKRLLQASESTLRLLVIKRLTPEVAKSELKGIIRSFEEVLHDTLTRQELELEALVDCSGKSPSLTMAYRGAFDLVKDIYNTIEPAKRTPGRPKGA
jgi:hypothetical protein